MKTLTPEQEADKMLLRWAARESGLTGRDVGAILREDGILTASRLSTVRDWEVPMSVLERSRH